MIGLGLSLMPEPDFATAALPLLANGTVDTVEWSFDMGWGPGGTPTWLAGVLNDYAAAGQLLGHGVSFSLLAGDWTEHHRGWLDRLRRETETRSYRHVSEHIGFVGAGRFSFAAPLPVPVSQPVIEMGAARLKMIADCAGCPVGVENLATTLGPSDLADQGTLIKGMLEPVDGHLVLDLHNVWCQQVNLAVPATEILADLPLERVLEIHVSGGSWDDRSSAERPLRRDTHDDIVPDEVWALLDTTMGQCSSLETVVYERLGTTLADPATHEPFRRDIERLADSLAHHG